MGQPTVREWARAQGWDVGIRGRLSAEIRAAYAAEIGEPPPQEVPSQAVRCKGCDRIWTGLRECHCGICHRHFSQVRSFDDHRTLGTHNQCADPLTLTRKDGRPMYKVTEGAWGPVIVSAIHGFADDEPETVLL